MVDRDRGLVDSPLREGAGSEPLTGDLADGVRALRDGEIDEAQAALQRHAVSHPNSAFARYHLGLAAIERGRADDARRHFQAAFDLNPQLHGALCHLGALYLNAGEEVAALRAYEQAIALAPDDVRCLAGVAAARSARGLWSEAVEAYRAAIRIAPGHGSLLYDYAITLIDRLQFQAACDVLDDAITVRPQFARAWAAKAVCLQALGRLDEAFGAARHGVEALPAPAADNHVALARVRVARGEVGEALAELERAVKREPDNAGAVLAFGELADAAGLKDVARSQYERFLRLPARGADDARHVRDRLKFLSGVAKP